ncbi:MAG: hypothetical protein WCB96_00190 [Candidatus Aminicenantales bacterium]
MKQALKSPAPRPYFLWDTAQTDEDVRRILKGDNEYQKIQMMVRILERCRWDEIWQYLTLQELRKQWPKIHRRIRRELRPTWEWAMEVWEHGRT